jgi:S1-C subfamily serine protease
MRNRITHLFAMLLLTAVGAAVQAQPGQKAFMGVTVDTVTTPLRKQYKLKANQGILVKEVLPNSSALAAGIRVNDVIVQLDDSTIRATPQFVALVQRHKAGDTVKLTLYRDGKKRVLPVLLKSRSNPVE